LPKLIGDNDDLEVADGFSISENHFDLFLSLIPSGYPTQKQMSLNWPPFCLLTMSPIIFQTPAERSWTFFYF